jgi:hypothetical protein
MIYLRTSDENLYESVRQQLDAAWGHPTPDGRTVTCVSPSSIVVRDSQNRIMLAIQEEFIAYEPAATMLPSLIAASVVEQISEADYMTAVPRDLP